MRTKMKRFFGILLSVALMLGLMPGMSLTARADGNPPYKSLGVSGINNPTWPSYNDMTWTGDYVYYGGHRFRVLDKDTTDFSTDDGILPPKHTMLLDSDSVLAEHIRFNNDAEPNTGAERASEWEYSDLKAWLNDSNNGFLNRFSEAEIAGIASSTKPDPVAKDGKGFPNMRYAPLKDDRVFVLDAVEASRPDYGYSATTGNVSNVEDSLSRVKKTTDYDTYGNTLWSKNVGYSGIWWLRSPFYSPRYPQYAGFVNGVSAVDYNDHFSEGGYFSTNVVNHFNPGASPALNVDLDSVLLSTRVNNNNVNYNNEYKLTLIYDKLETAITQGMKISINNGTVTVPYTVTDKDPDDGIQADYISVLVVEGDRTNGTIKKYEPLTGSLVFNNGTASGEATISLPDDFDSSKDKIYVFAEDTNAGMELTDYASAPLELLQPGAVSGLVYNGTEQTLLNDTNTIPTGCSVKYALSESAPAEGSYSSEIPKAKNAGTYRIWYKATENNASNTIGPNSMTVTIAKKRVGVSGVIASDKQYDGTRNVTLSGGTLNSSDIVSSDEISIASLEGRFKFADAGEDKPVTVTKITLDGASKDNYAASYTDQNNLTATVTQKPVIVTGITAVNKEYDGTKTATLNTGSASIEGIVPIDTAVYNPLTVSSKSTAEFGDAAFGINKTVNLGIKLGGYCALNYTLSEDSQKTATANITKSITIKANDQRVGRRGTIKSGVDNVSVTSGSLEEGHRISNVTLTSGSTDSPTNNGTITLKSVVIQDADENDVTAMYIITPESGVLTVTEKYQMTVTAPNVTETYDGRAHGIVVNVTDPESGATVKYGETEGTYELDESPTLTNVSESPKTVYYKVTAGGYVDYSGSATITIEPRSVVVSGIKANSRTYNGKTGAELDYSDVKFNGETISGLTVTATGEFASASAGQNKTVNISNIVLAGTGTENYVLSTSGQQTTTKADISAAQIPAGSITAPVKIEKLTYNGSAQDLVTAGKAEGGTMMYALGTATEATEAYTASIPSKANAGTYYVWYKVVGDANHNNVGPEKVSVSIGKADATITAKDQTIKEGESVAEGTGNVAVSGLVIGHSLDAISLESGTGETAGKVIASDARIKDRNNQDVTSNYTVAYTPGTLTVRAALSRTVTFKVANGKWDDGTTADKTVTLTGYEGDTLKLTADQIPSVGTKPNDTYKAGNWDVTPSAEIAITEATTYTYTYAQKDSISQTVTFKVVNGKWDDDSTADKTVTLTGYEGDTLKLAANQIPAVGTKPNDAYKAGSWDVIPSTDTAITEATTYKYIYVAKEASVVTKAPEAKTLTYNGSAQELVTAGEATGGEMQYAIGDANGATQPYTTSIPAKTEAGTYYIWYKVVGNGNYNGIDAEKVTVNISKKPLTITAGSDSKKFDGTALVKDSYTSTEPAEGESIVSVTITGSQTKDGTSDNVASNAVIKKGDTDVTANYEIKYVKGILTVLKSDSLLEKVPVANTGLEENGTEQALVTAGSANNGKLVYSLEENGTYSEDIPTGKDAGNYKVWYKVIGNDGYNDTEAGYIEVVIAKKDESASNTENTENGSGNESGSEEGTLNDQTEDDDNSNVNNGGTDSGNGENGTNNGGTDSGNGENGTNNGGTDSGNGENGTNNGGSDSGNGENETNNGSKTGNDNTSGSGSKTGRDNTSGSGSTTDSDVKVKENADGTKTETVETTNTDGSTTKTQTTKDAEGNVLQTVTQSTEKNDDGSTVTTKSTENSDGTYTIRTKTVTTDGSTVTKTESKDASGTVSSKVTTKNDESTTVYEEIHNPDNSVVERDTVTNKNGTSTIKETKTESNGNVITKTETVNKNGTGRSDSTTVDEKGKEISTTSTETTKNKKGTVIVKSETENLEATGSEVKHVDSTVKTYTSEKVKSEITETKADGSSVKTENTIKADKKGNLTVTSKVTEKDADGNTTKSTTTATVKVKKSGALTLSEIDAKGEVAVIPDSVVSNGKTVPVTTIGKGAMQGNETITDVKLGDNITKISKNAFKGDKNLEHIELTDSIESIAKNAFKGIAKDAVFTIKAASEEEFNRIVDLIKKSGVGENVTFVFENTSK